MVKHESFFDQINKNKRASVLLFSAVLVVVGLLLYVFAQVYNPEFTFVFLIIGLTLMVIHSLISYYKGDSIVLRSVKAYPADDIKHRHLIDTVEGLAIASRLPKPKIWIIPSKEINAFATGRDPEHASVAITEGALEKLKRDEIEGVMAHEMSHIGNYDIRYAMLVAVFVGLVAILSEMFLRSLWFSGGDRDNKNAVFLIIGIVLAIFAPLIVRIVQLSISRKREYLADATAVKLTRYPQGLANALKKIKQTNTGRMKVSEAESHLFIDDPKKSFVDNLFATHPPIDKRIEKLESM